MPAHHDAKQLAALGRDWIAAWNSHDLERVLALYSDDFEMTSDIIPTLGFDAVRHVARQGECSRLLGQGTVDDDDADLRFELIDTYVSPDSIVVFYQNERGHKICEYLRLNAEGKIRQGSANHLTHP